MLPTDVRPACLIVMSEDKHTPDYTLQVRTPDSWEGWRWGATHMWGMEPLGTFTPKTNTFKDIAEHTDMIFFWGCDWETTSRQNCGQETTLWSQFYRSLGIKFVFVCPDLNYTAAVYGHKWIPVYPNTDGALMLAIAYIWITEDTYDKEYLATHTHEFDKFKAYVMGEEDGIPKTPKWASPLCGVPVWTIKALAREWASKTAAFASSTAGGVCRGSYSTEPVRIQIACVGHAGTGKAGDPPVWRPQRPQTYGAHQPIQRLPGSGRAQDRLHPTVSQTIRSQDPDL